MATTQITVRVPNQVFIKLSDYAESANRRVVDEIRERLARSLNDDVVAERLTSLESRVSELSSIIRQFEAA